MTTPTAEIEAAVDLAINAMLKENDDLKQQLAAERKRVEAYQEELDIAAKELKAAVEALEYFAKDSTYAKAALAKLREGK